MIASGGQKSGGRTRRQTGDDVAAGVSEASAAAGGVQVAGKDAGKRGGQAAREADDGCLSASRALIR